MRAPEIAGSRVSHQPVARLSSVRSVNSSSATTCGLALVSVASQRTGSCCTEYLAADSTSLQLSPATNKTFKYLNNNKREELYCTNRESSFCSQQQQISGQSRTKLPSNDARRSSKSSSPFPRELRSKLRRLTPEEIVSQ